MGMLGKKKKKYFECFSGIAEVCKHTGNLTSELYYFALSSSHVLLIKIVKKKYYSEY